MAKEKRFPTKRQAGTAGKDSTTATVRRHELAMRNQLVAADAQHRSVRRRVFAALRRAHRVLGRGRKGLGQGIGLNKAQGGTPGPWWEATAVSRASRPACAAAGRLFTAGVLALYAIPANANTALVGATITATTQDAMALGHGATAGNAGAVALGSAVNAGPVDAERSITNVAVGRINAASTDAINGSQRYASNQALQSILADAAVHFYSVDGGPTEANYNNDGATGLNSLAAGLGASGGGNYSTAVGYLSNASGSRNTAIGAGATATGTTDSIAVGGNSLATASQASSYGFNSEASGVRSTALGSAAVATGDGTTAVGRIALAEGLSATAVGHSSSASGDSALALGNAAIAGNANDVALGSGSATAVAVATPSIVIGGTTYNFAGIAPTSTVSVGAPGAERTVTNVAAGRINAASTDAINGSQLFATNTQVSQNTTDIANLDTSVSSINNGAGITYFHAHSTLADSQAVGTDSVAVGPNAVSNNTNSMAMGNGAVGSIDGAVALGAGSVSDRVLASTSGTIPGGSGYVPYNTSDATLLGAVSVGNAATDSYRQITNVADGTDARDAVTVRQLQGAIGSVSATDTKYFHANSTEVDSLAAGIDAIAVGPTTVVNGDKGIGMGNGAVVQMTAPGGTAIGQQAQVSQADAIALGTQARADGIQSIAIGAGAQAVYSGSVAVGAGATTTVGSRTQYVAYALAAPQASAGEVSVGSAGAERQITNVAAGSAATDVVNVSQLNQVAQNSATALGGGAMYDPITGTYTAPSYSVGGQTYNSVGDAVAAQDTIVSTQGSSLTSYLGGGANYNIATGSIGTGFTVNGNTYATVADAIGDSLGAAGNSVQYDNSDRSQITLEGASGTKITNLAPGTISGTSTDAVNGSQLYQTNTTVNNLVQGKAGLVQQENADAPIAVGGNTGGTAVNMAGTAGDRRITGVADGAAPNDAATINQLNSVTQGISGQFARLNNRIDRVENRANAGIASAMAMAALPQAYLPSKSMLSLGGASWNGESGYAIGLSTVSDNGSWVLKLSGATSSRGDYGGAVGVGYQW